MIVPEEHQEKYSTEILAILRKYGLAYIAWEERTGKSLTGMLVAEKSKAKSILIVTKSKAKKGWEKLLKNFPHTKQYTLVTYGKITSISGRFDLVILDESHNYIAGYPKPSTTWKKVYKVIYGLPILYMTATPHAQGRQQLYHQLALSKWSPFKKYNNFYSWFKDYGIPYYITINDREVAQYNRVQEDKVAEATKHLFHTKTRKELGFKHEPKDQLHYIELDAETKKLYNTILKKKVLVLDDVVIAYDTTARLRAGLHALEGGTLKFTSYTEPEALLKYAEKIEDAIVYHAYLAVGNTEKIQYILNKWGDSEDIAIMYNYKGEKPLLKQYFNKALILQATSFAEGIDLGHIRHLIIYSQDWSTARHTQRRARQASKYRKWPITVHFLLVKNAISEEVYITVAKNKRNM